jgi:type VI secretion system protein ImpH
LLDKLAQQESREDGSTPALRIQPELNLDYPQADIAEIGRDEKTGNYQITTTFFGLYGVSSPLPGFYTEELLDDEWDELGARKAFFDVIHNHLYPLLYQAWLKYRFSHNVVEFENPRYEEIVFSLIGLGEDYRKDAENYGYLLKYAGLLSQRIKSLSGLKTILRDYLDGIGVDIKPCIKRKVSIARHQRCLLGRQNTSLGGDVCIGKEVVDRGGKFSVELGPLSADQFADMTAHGDIIDWVRTILKLFLVQPLKYSITLLLEPGAETPARIGDAGSSLLGNNCWLVSAANPDVGRVDLPMTNL